MEDNTFHSVVHDDSEPLSPPEANGTALTEVDGNAMPDDLKDTAAKSQKQVNWGGDSKEPGLDDENQQPDAGDQGDALAAVGIKKKKRKSKSKGKKGLNAPTGFEEYYVDVPVTPAEFDEEQSIYHKSNSFSERVESAIQRYISKRKFDSGRKDLFDKYMVYGGVSAGPKMFGGGLDAKILEESNAAEIAQFTATNYVDYEKEDPRSSEYVVDFDGVVKGFLSSRLPQTFGIENEQRIKNHVAIIRNFLNYLLHHDVCPEYNDQIYAARATCNLAEKELWSVSQASRILPGDFNKACSVIFGGSYQDAYIGGSEWARGLDVDTGMSEDRAKKVFLAGLAAHGDDKVFQKYNKHVSKNKAEVVEIVNTGLEIVRLQLAEPEVVSYYTSPDNPVKGLSPLGQMKVQTWYDPGAAQDDLTEEEEKDFKEKGRPISTYTIWVEDAVMSKLFVGMRIVGDLRRLSFGPWFLDSVTQVHCSFYDILPNELMLGWREHKYLPPRGRREDGEDHGEIIDNPYAEAGQEIMQEGDAEGPEYQLGEDIAVGE